MRRRCPAPAHTEITPVLCLLAIIRTCGGFDAIFFPRVGNAKIDPCFLSLSFWKAGAVMVKSVHSGKIPAQLAMNITGLKRKYASAQAQPVLKSRVPAAIRFLRSKAPLFQIGNTLLQTRGDQITGFFRQFAKKNSKPFLFHAFGYNSLQHGSTVHIGQ